MSAPLAGVRVLEVESIGPVPWAGMLLAGMGAEVTRLRRPVAADMGIPRDARFEIQNHGKRTTTADLKTPQGRDAALDLVQDAHILLEGLRPGVMERLGLGPDICRERNPSLVYGRATGWGQSGPLAQTVGHDINYLAATGVLHAIGSADAPPTVPLNLIGDFGAGGMLLVSGVLAALVQARATGKGCVVDAAIVDGALALMAPILGRWQEGQWHDARERNLFDGGAPFYATYATADGKAVAVGAIEPRFYAALLAGLGLDASTLAPQHDQASWPRMRERFAGIFAQHDRAHWCRVFEGTEACVSPVLSLSELAAHPHLRARTSLVDRGGILHPAPAPRFLD